MDPSIRSYVDPTARAPIGERRRNIRQKLHTPVYASFNGPRTGMVVDLSELLDLHEEGFAVQTSQRLEINQPVTVCLDLPETQSYVHCTGQVIWSDDAGRGGVRFSTLSEKSRQILKEWLFANLMIGSANHAARTEQMARREEALPEEATIEKGPSTIHPKTDRPSSVPSIVPLSDGSASLSAVEAVRVVIREMGDHLDAIAQMIAERALSFTGASGAALALMMDGKMVCRARAGEQAPPLGAAVDVKQGLSGECVRNGVLVSCEDTENDPRVDPEVCRALGIGSLMAAPILSGLEVIGLLEVFSTDPRHFKKVHETVLNRLVELIPQNNEARSPASDSPASPTGLASTEFAATQFAATDPTLKAFSEPHVDDGVSQNVEPVLEEPSSRPSRLLYRALLGLAIIAVFVVVGYLVAPVIDKRWAVSPQASQRSGALRNEAGSNASGAGAVETNLQANYLSDLRKRADQGDAEAEWQLGARYHNGDGVSKDDAQAMQWFERAAENGNVMAQATLGAYYWAGRGVPQDLSKAYFWSTLAYAQGDETSKARLEGLNTQMTRDQVMTARQQAEAWLHSHGEPGKSASN